VIDTAAISRFGLLLVRPSLLVSTTPVFGGIHIPIPVRIALGIMLSLTIAPVVPAPQSVGTLGLVAVIGGEALIGIALGLGVRILVGAAELAGHLAGFQIGFSYAAIVDPQSGVRNNVVAALYANLAMVTFLGINGHHAVIRALAGSYEVLPIGAAGVSGPLAPLVAHMLGLVFVTGARLAAPVVTALLLVEILMGLIARAAPSLNLLIVGTPLRLLAGMLALAAGIQVVPGVIAGATTPALESAIRLVRAFH
jgi:flagellar biosynthetic protein FliR